MESRNKQKISGISYNIISYNQLNLDLLWITQNVVTDFLDLVGVHASTQTLECKGDDKLVNEWKALGIYEEDDDGAFSSRLAVLDHKATLRLSPGKTVKKIFVTNQNIGGWMGLNFGGIAIVSSCEIIENDLETFATAVFHELGHIHKIPCERRTNLGKCEVSDTEIVALENSMRGKNAIFECKGEHCLNLGCSMRQRLCFQNWKDHITKERLEIGRPYCDKCLADLKGFFKNSAEG